MIKKLTKEFLNIKQNMATNADLYYIVEDSPWSIYADGNNITKNLSTIKGVVSKTTIGVKKKAIIHFGSYNLYINKKRFPSNPSRIIATCFHLIDADERNERIHEVDKYIGKWHTSCNITKKKLIEYGVSAEKVTVIPIPVNNQVYKPASNDEEKELIKKKYKVPQDATIIGSFQKDGNGWGEGLEPKLIKGPDVFCDVIEKLASEKEIFVILSGPARGYVKKRLDKVGVEYVHYLFENPEDVAELYKITDLYMVTSREEGGPKAILESMASGVPIISTKVGMAPELIKDGENGFMVDIEDTEIIVKKAQEILNDANLRKKLILNGFLTAKEYDVKIIASRYEKELYNA